MRKTIYISGEDLWDEIREAAGRENRSVSNYLVELHLAKMRLRGCGLSVEEFYQDEVLADEVEPKKVSTTKPKSDIIAELRANPYFNPMPKSEPKPKKGKRK